MDIQFIADISVEIHLPVGVKVVTAILFYMVVRRKRKRKR